MCFRVFPNLKKIYLHTVPGAVSCFYALTSKKLPRKRTSTEKSAKYFVKCGSAFIGCVDKDISNSQKMPKHSCFADIVPFWRQSYVVVQPRSHTFLQKAYKRGRESKKNKALSLTEVSTRALVIPS